MRLHDWGAERLRNLGAARLVLYCGLSITKTHSFHILPILRVFLFYCLYSVPGFAGELGLNVEETLARVLPLVRTFR